MRDGAGRSPALSKLPAAAVGWVEPLRNPSRVAVAVMGFASTLAVLQFADEIAQPILQTGTESGTLVHGLARERNLETRAATKQPDGQISA